MYRTFKLYTALAILAVFILTFGIWQWNRTANFVPVPATVGSVDTQCATGKTSHDRTACVTDNAQANRITAFTVAYRSPADRRMHEATIECTTTADEPIQRWGGQAITIDAHTSEPGTVAFPKCQQVSPSETRS